MLNPILISLQAIIGLILIFDGIGSIILYWHQTPIEHLVRILRAFLGAAVILIAILINSG